MLCHLCSGCGSCVVAGTCVVAPQVCGATQVTGVIVCASSALTVAAGTVAGAPSGTNDITSKCYVDAEITANAGGVCCVQTYYQHLPYCFNGGNASSTSATTAITQVPFCRACIIVRAFGDVANSIDGHGFHELNV